MFLPTAASNRRTDIFDQIPLKGKPEPAHAREFKLDCAVELQ